MELLQSIPNFSEGRDLKKIKKIISAFENQKYVKILNFESDADHNRTVVTIIGEPCALEKSLIKFVKYAISEIDLNYHKGLHPRMGAVDIIPFVPIKNISLKESIEFSKKIAKNIFQECNLPIFLYEYSAKNKERRNLANLRRGGFEKMAEKLKEKKWRPDFGNDLHKSAGITAIGIRKSLLAYNVNLKSQDINIAKKIAKKIRFSSGGLQHCKAIGLKLKNKNLVQVSTNLTNYKKTSIFDVFTLIKSEALKENTKIFESELIGLAPSTAINSQEALSFKIKNFSQKKILETQINKIISNFSQEPLKVLKFDFF